MTGPCACGAQLFVPDSMDLWEDMILAHVRTKRHQDWWALEQLRSEARTIIDVRIGPDGLLSAGHYGPVVWVQRARFSQPDTSVRRVA